MKVSRWGGSLAVRLPKAVVERLGLAEGDELVVSETSKGGVELNRGASAAQSGSDTAVRRAALVEALSTIRVKLPTGYQFNRDEANER
jgi:antitoxin MazE